jgi:hypothetical protein
MSMGTIIVAHDNDCIVGTGNNDGLIAKIAQEKANYNKYI